jgi:hypothetical protein
MAVPFHSPEKERMFRSLRGCVIFKRGGIARNVPPYEYYFPQDPLQDILHSWDRQYFRYCQHVISNLKPHEERSYWEKAAEIAKTRIEMHTAILKEEWSRLGLDPELCVRYQDCIRKFEYYAQVFRQPKLSVARLKAIGLI